MNFHISRCWRSRIGTLPETEFIIKRDKHFDLRWMTPTVEADICGHATLASGRVIFIISGARKKLSACNRQWRTACDNSLRTHPVLVETIRQKDAARGKFRSAVANYSVKTEENALESVGTR